MKSICWAAGMLLVASSGLAETEPVEAQEVAAKEVSAPGPTFEVETLHFTSGVKNKQPVNEKAQFATGEKAWVWMEIKPTAERPKLKLRWIRNGELYWAMKARFVPEGRAWFYKTVYEPGTWAVEVLDQHGTLVAKKSFAVMGEPKTPPGMLKKKPAARAKPKAALPIKAKVKSAGERAVAAASKEGPEVVDLQFTEAIAARNPVAPSRSFSQGAEVFTWLKLKVQQPETEIRIRWSLGDKAVFVSDPISVRKSAGWRTWLSKRVGNAGQWKVEVLDAGGQVIHAAPFMVN